jgi:acetyltransferase-like isoleucine patch superfamily enzyme
LAGALDRKGKKNHDTVTLGPIIVADDVLIEQNSILSVVPIGTGAVKGAGAVVASDIPSYAVMLGNPARVVRLRFDPDTVIQLLQVHGGNCRTILWLDLMQNYKSNVSVFWKL